MVNVKEFVKTWSGKKELYDLPALELATLDIKSDEFTTETGAKKAYNYIEVGGYKYSLKAGIMAQIKQIIETKPLVSKIQFKRAPNGDVVVFDL